MAACLITISGTSGEVEINYLIGITPHTLKASIGTLYIEDTATAVTYTTLSGDAIATSGCLTITNLPFICYRINWKAIKADSYKFNQVYIGLLSFVLPDSVFPNNTNTLAPAVNGLADNRIKVTAVKIVFSTISTDPLLTEYNYIIRVLGTAIPIFRIKNADNTGYIFLHGVVSACLPVGYTAIDVCESPISLT